MSDVDEQSQSPAGVTTYVPLAEAVLIFQAGGVFRSERTISRYCEIAALDCIKEQLPSGAMGYLINRESIQDRIMEMKQLATSGHVATSPNTSRQDETRQDTSGHDETELKELKSRLEKAEGEADALRDENMQLKIDVGVRKELLNEARKFTSELMGDRDGLLRHAGVLEGQVRQLGGEPMDGSLLVAPETQHVEIPDQSDAEPVTPGQ